MADTARPLVPPRLVLGLVVLLVGLLFLADSTGMLRADSAFAAWPVGIIALGLVVVLQPDPGNRLVGAVLLVAGVWLLLNTVGVWSYSFWRAWPYVLILFGAWILFRVDRMREREGPAGRGRLESRRFDEEATDASSIGAFAFLSRVSRRATSDQLEAGDFSVVGGDCHVDLQAATPAARAPVIVDVFALAGRVTLRVPSGWRVETRVLPLLGQVIVPATHEHAGGPVIVVQGTAICGRVSVSTGQLAS